MAENESMEQWIARARSADILATAKSLGAHVRRVTAKEWAGPCPLCGGYDRFSVNTQKQVFFCRPTEGGDVIKLVEHVQGKSFTEAGTYLNGDAPPDNSRNETMAQRAARMAARTRQEAELEMRRARADREAAEKDLKDVNVLERMLNQMVPLQGTQAEAYMREERGLNPDPKLTQDLMFLNALPYWGVKSDRSDKLEWMATLPALCALIRRVDDLIIGVAITYLDPYHPKKYTPEGSRKNSPKKIRGEKQGGMIRLGPIGAKLAIAEGWENALAWDALRARGRFGDTIAGEEISLAAAVDKGNLCGGSIGRHPLPDKMDVRGKPVTYPSGIPDMTHPGVILPDEVQEIFLIGDGPKDKGGGSLAYQRADLAGSYATGARRFANQGKSVLICQSPENFDWNDVLKMEETK